MAAPAPEPQDGFAQSEVPNPGLTAAAEVPTTAPAVPPAAARITGVSKSAKRRPSSQGIFAPLVRGSKRLLGDDELNQLRGKVIAQHSNVISAFVDTSESKFGQLVLKRMFDAADTDGNGSLDKDEIHAALLALGFDFLADRQVNGILERADSDENEVIDFEEFVKDAPRTLRTNLIKLAKKNGHDLGFLA